MFFLFTFCKARWERRKKRKENHATKVTKIPETKIQKYGLKETNVSLVVKFQLDFDMAIQCQDF